MLLERLCVRQGKKNNRSEGRKEKEKQRELKEERPVFKVGEIVKEGVDWKKIGREEERRAVREREKMGGRLLED